MYVEQLDSWRWRIPRHGNMRTDGLVFANAPMLAQLQRDQSLEQVCNVACLPGIVGPALAMPDIHSGYGFPIGGVAAFDANEGVVSPGGVGYDINCGVRLLRTALHADELRPQLARLADRLFQSIPSGLGSQRSDLKLSHSEERKVLELGASWAVARGYGQPSMLEKIEERGTLPDADSETLSSRALERGRAQLGTLGGGNHFLEVQRVDAIYDEEAATVLGLCSGQVTVSIHTGSRGLGHQVCDDYLRVMRKASHRYGIHLPDQQLCCAPLGSPEAKQYLSAMSCAANFAFANRQVISGRIAECLEEVTGKSPAELRLDVIYDVCHNIAKWEEHIVNGQSRRLCVHRKGATRAFPAGHPQTPAAYRHIGQPVLVPGDMGRYSYVLIGAQGAMQETFGSICHGAGRQLSRQAAKKQFRHVDIFRRMAEQGIVLRASGRTTVVEEVPEAYKDVADVVHIVEEAGLAKIVARLVPLAVIKG